VWPAGRTARILAAASLALSVSGDVLTFAYFYPRNAIMFGPAQQPLDVLRDAWAGWSTMNWIRSGICLLALVCELRVLSALETHFASRPNGQLS
jgi:hypothetical protein